MSYQFAKQITQAFFYRLQAIIDPETKKCFGYRWQLYKTELVYLDFQSCCNHKFVSIKNKHANKLICAKCGLICRRMSIFPNFKVIEIKNKTKNNPSNCLIVDNLDNSFRSLPFTHLQSFAKKIAQIEEHYLNEDILSPEEIAHRKTLSPQAS